MGGEWIPVKRLIVINGPPGVGKSTTSRHLLDLLPPAAWLDGDWCWTMNPWRITPENRAMVEANIISVLGRFLENGSFADVIFSWVLPRPGILESLLERMAPRPGRDYLLHRFTLMCGPGHLRERMLRAGRAAGDIQASLDSLDRFSGPDSVLVDTGRMSALETAWFIADHLYSLDTFSHPDPGRGRE